MQLNHPSQSIKISFLNQRVVDLFQGKNFSIGEDLFGNHDLRISFKNEAHTFCNDFTNILRLELYFKSLICIVLLCVVCFGFVCLFCYPKQLISFVCYPKFLSKAMNNDLFISYLMFNEFVPTYPALVQIYSHFL